MKLGVPTDPAGTPPISPARKPPTSTDGSADKPTAEISWQDIEAWMEELREMARGLLRQEGHRGSIATGQLVLSALRRQKRDGQDWNEVRWSNRRQFFGYAYRAMNRALIDYARARARRREVRFSDLPQGFGGHEAGELDLREFAAVVAADEGRARTVEEVLERLEAKHPGMDLPLIVCHYGFGGLGQEEIARLLGINVRTVRRRLAIVKIFLENALRHAVSGESVPSHE